jgi:hypothetical protein
MKPDVSDKLISHLDKILAEFYSLQERGGEDYSDLHTFDIQGFLTMAQAAIEQIGGSNSVYARDVKEIMDEGYGCAYEVASIAGVVKALRAGLEAGYLQGITELIHGELFADFLDMASHLLDEGYKDPAAVIAGAALETHLRQLCDKQGIQIEVNTATGIHAKKAALINADLAKASVYGKLDQKNVTAWLDLRNKAAHGKFEEYTKEQVAVMLLGIKDFIARNPA